MLPSLLLSVVPNNRLQPSCGARRGITGHHMKGGPKHPRMPPGSSPVSCFRGRARDQQDGAVNKNKEPDVPRNEKH